MSRCTASTGQVGEHVSEGDGERGRGPNTAAAVLCECTSCPSCTAGSWETTRDICEIAVQWDPLTGPVYVAAVSHSKNQDDELVVVNLVDDAIVARPDSPLA